MKSTLVIALMKSTLIIALLLLLSVVQGGQVTLTFDFEDTLKDGKEMVGYLEECGWHASIFVNSQRLCMF